MVPLKGVMAVFSYDYSWLIYGDTPPAPGNWLRKDWLDYGTFDPRSVIKVGDEVYWANHEGVYRSDGQITTNITDKGDMGNFWRSKVRNFDSDWICASGYFLGDLYVSIYDGDAGLTKETFVYNIEQKTWREVTNLDAGCYVAGADNVLNQVSPQDLYFGRRKAARIGSGNELALPGGILGAAAVPIPPQFWPADAYSPARQCSEAQQRRQQSRSAESRAPSRSTAGPRCGGW